MARKRKNTVDYFPHIINEGKTMFIIESKYKNDGYATWYKILERLGKSENHFIDLSDTKELMYLASKCNMDEDKLKSIIKDLVDLGEFDKYLWDSHSVIWGQKFVDSIEDVYKRRYTEMPTINLICQQLGIKCKQKEQNDDRSTQSKVKDSKVKEIIKEYSFEDFWNLYNKKVGVKEKIEKKYNNLSLEVKKKIFEYIPLYVESQPNKQYRKNPETFLNNEGWNDEIIKQPDQHPAGKLHAGKKDYSHERL